MSETWEYVTLDEISEDITVGHVGPMADQYLDVGVPFLRSLNVEPFCISTTDLKYISREFHQRLKKSALKPGDILIVRTGKPGSCAVIPNWLLEANCSDVVVVKHGPKVRPGYICYVVNSTAAHHIDAHTVGAVQQHFNVASARQIRLRLPPIAEQDRILSILGALDDKIYLNRCMNETLEAMARALFKDWFVDFGPTRAKMEGRAPYLAPEVWSLFPDKLDGKEKPEGWIEYCIDDLAELNPSERLAQGTLAPYIDMAALPIRGPWPDAPIRREFGSGARFRNGDTLFARITPCLENGKTAYVACLGADEIAWGSTEFIVIRPRPPVPPELGYLLARDENFRAHAIRSMTGTSGRQRVQLEALRSFSFVSSTNDLFVTFGALVSATFNKIAANSKENETLSATRDLLLPKLMSGEIRVKHAAKIREAAL